jgi:hypothetical protein
MERRTRRTVAPGESRKRKRSKGELSAMPTFHALRLTVKVAMARKVAVRLYWMCYRICREVECRPHGWASRSLQREFEEAIMVEVQIEEMFGSD